jgi:hypothetical protein
MIRESVKRFALIRFSLRSSPGTHQENKIFIKLTDSLIMIERLPIVEIGINVEEK